MNDIYLIAASQGKLIPFSGLSHAEQVGPVLRDLLEKSGAPARRVQEIHWHGGDQEFWLSAFGRPQRASTALEFGFAPDLARYQWPAAPLLAHFSLQSIARALEVGDADLVLIAQETGDQVVALLMASPGAVGRYNLAPRARLASCLAKSSAPDGLLKAACVALEKAARGQPEQADGDSAEEDWDAARIHWLAAARQPDPASLKVVFPAARWLGPGAEIPPGDLFLFSALAARMAKEKAQSGLLLSEGPQKSGLVTLVERV